MTGENDSSSWRISWIDSADGSELVMIHQAVDQRFEAAVLRAQELPAHRRLFGAWRPAQDALKGGPGQRVGVGARLLDQSRGDEPGLGVGQIAVEQSERLL